MSKIIFTESQQKAYNINNHISVTANAGSGKTTVLINRYIKILLETNCQIDELVAITFTEKAASELKKKIAENVNNKLISTLDIDVPLRNAIFPIINPDTFNKKSNKKAIVQLRWCGED